MRSIENKRAQPDQRPPYPTTSRAVGPTDRRQQRRDARPRAVDRGQRLGRLRRHRRRRAIPGTTLVQFSGAVSKPGIAEVPLGMSLRKMLDIVRRHRRRQGGARRWPGRRPAATGRARHALHARGADREGRHHGLGHDRRRRRPDVPGRHGHAARALPVRRVVRQDDPVPHRTCAACTRSASRATEGIARPVDSQVLQELAADVRAGALCGLEYCAPNPFLTGMRYFADEFDAALRARHMPRRRVRPVVCRSPARTCVSA